RTVVTVTAAGRADEATAILRRNGAYDMSTRGVASTAAPAAARATGTATHASTAHAGSREAEAGGTIQGKDERLRAERRPVEPGGVRVRKEVHTETKHLDVPVEREEIVIERTPVHGRAAEAAAAGDIREGEELRIPVREEKVNVTKE